MIQLWQSQTREEQSRKISVYEEFLGSKISVYEEFLGSYTLN